jgi:AraC family transcriptional regulator, positive regulator of tynA and feaB
MTESIQSWSTTTVPPAMRFDYWITVVRNALWPVTDFKVASQDFVVDLQEAPLGCLTSILENISPHRARRNAIDVARTEERSYLLFASLAPSWGINHNGRCESLRRGDIVLVGDGEHETDVPTGFHGIILKCPAHWLHSWLPDPDLLVGRAIPGDSTWGRVLSPALCQFTPAFAVNSPLPHSVLTDQLGTLLAMTAGAFDTQARTDLHRQIDEQIVERSCDPQLTGDDIAATLNLPARIVHQTLAAHHTSFATRLLDVRVGRAVDMLQSESCSHLTLDEIAARTGFSGPTHLARTVRTRTGLTPLQLRARNTAPRWH